MTRGAREIRDRLAVVCTTALRVLPIEGAALALITRRGQQAIAHWSDELAQRLDEMQMTLGQGPSIDAHNDGHPVLSEDLAAADAGRRWPVFADAATRVGVHALYAFPLRIGVIEVGVLTMYRHERRGLGADELSLALQLADSAAFSMLDLFGADGEASDHRSVANPLGAGAVYRAHVHQASGMLMIQLGIPIEEALARLRAYAFAENLALGDVARGVVARTLRLEQ
ncbi:MAG: GAF and ANTAR domain-containing protein [Jatrophihabitantaceae bacterium]